MTEAVNSTPRISISSVPEGGNLLLAELFISQPRERIFPYFADAFNLEQLTPEFLRFKVLTPAPIAIAKGTRIDYKLRVSGISFRWQSEITVWNPPEEFVDEQRRGPYRFWIHRHTFESSGDGTIVRDRVRYAVPGGFLVQKMFVERRLREIFTYRHRRLAATFS